MKCYLIWAVDLPEETDTADRDRYIERFPDAAQYGQFYLFPAAYSEVTELTCQVVDLASQTVGDEADLIEDEFLAIHDSMAQEEMTGRCVVLSVQQGKLLHKERYAPTENVV